MNKICTSIEQSNKLLELRIDRNTADMHHVLIDSDKEIYDIGFGNYIGILPHHPAWSLTALLELMPNTHLKKYIYDGKTRYYITKVGIESHNSEHYDNPIDAAFQMVCWLKENEKI